MENKHSQEAREQLSARTSFRLELKKKRDILVEKRRDKISRRGGENLVRIGGPWRSLMWLKERDLDDGDPLWQQEEKIF